MKTIGFFFIAIILFFSSCYIPRLNRMKRGEYKNRLAKKKFEMPRKDFFLCNAVYKKRKQNKKTSGTETYRFSADGYVQINTIVENGPSENSFNAVYRIKKRKLTIAYTEALNGKYKKEKFYIRGDSLISKRRKLVLLRISDSLR